jgi:hypothetical protein
MKTTTYCGLVSEPDTHKELFYNVALRMEQLLKRVVDKL